MKFFMTSSYFKCKSKRFQINIFSARNSVVSSSSKQIFDCITTPCTVYLNIHFPNTKYSLASSSVSFQYIGETEKKKKK